MIFEWGRNIGWFWESCKNTIIFEYFCNNKSFTIEDVESISMTKRLKLKYIYHVVVLQKLEVSSLACNVCNNTNIYA